MKKLRVLILMLVLVFILTGCSSAPFDSESMLRPPKTSGDGQEICEALESFLGRQPMFRYPRSGDHRSAVTMEDLNDDGTEEAIVFYATSTESTLANIAVLNYSHGEWKVASTAEGMGSNVNILLFGEILPDEKGKEIIVGWTVGANSGLLSAYSYEDKKLQNIPIEDTAGTEARSAAGYTAVAVCDMDGDGSQEIMTATLNTVAGTSTVRMLKYLSGEGAECLSVTGMTPLDGSVTRYSKVTVSMLDDTTQALLIDSYKGTDLMCTEAVCWDKINAKLKAPFNSSATGVVSGTDRAAVTDSFDVDRDGLTEIPSHTLLTCYSDASEQKYYRSSWYSYDSLTGSLSQQSELETILNTADGYYVTLAPSWPTDITVKYDPVYRTMSFCVAEISYVEATVSASDLTGEENVISKNMAEDSAVIEQRVESFGGELFKVRVFDKESEELVPSYSYSAVREENDNIWAVQIGSLGEQYGITYNIINTCFYLI